jgi:SAM-dependent methyltransferase
MRIIAVGKPEPAPDVVVDSALQAPDQEPVQSHVEQVAPAALEGAEELSDDDLAPDSDERPPIVELAPDALTAPAEEREKKDAVGVSVEVSGVSKPPPPPRRQQPSQPDEVAKAERPMPDDAAKKKPLRRPWWEEAFSEDFQRAVARFRDEDIRREVDFIEESLGVAPGGVVLDIGCGAGHHAVELARRGYGVVGYDLSLYQLALAADVAQEQNQKINFLQGDMREMAFEEMFDGIYCWNTTFGYFEEEKNLAVAQRVFRALRPGGMFLLDVANRDFAVLQQPSQVWYEGDACVCMDDMIVDFITSRLKVKRSIILDDGRTRECVYSVRLYALHELGKLLHDVGFRVTEASGHPVHPGVFFGPNSPRIIMLAQRP